MNINNAIKIFKSPPLSNIPLPDRLYANNVAIRSMELHKKILDRINYLLYVYDPTEEEQIEYKVLQRLIGEE